MVLLVAAGLAIVEAVARISGVEPWAAIVSERGDPALHEPDPVLSVFDLFRAADFHGRVP